MKICSRCQTVYEDEAVFCANCGIPLEDVEKTPQMEQSFDGEDTTIILDPDPELQKKSEERVEAVFQEEPAIAEMQNTNEAAQEENQSEKKRSINLFFLMAILVIVVLGIIFVPKLLSGGNTGYKPDNYIYYERGKEGVYGITDNGKVIPAPAALEEAYSFDYEKNAFANTFFYDTRNTVDSRSLWEFKGDSFKKIAEQVVDQRISLSGALAFCTENMNLYLYDGKSVHYITGGVDSLSCISPDGKAVGYIKNKENKDGFVGYYYNGQIHELGNTILPVALSNTGEYVYYRNSTGNLYVQKGTESDKAEKIGAFSYQDSHLLLNADGTEAILGVDAGTAYFIEKLEKEKISVLSSLLRAPEVTYQQYYPARSPVVVFYNVASLKQQSYYSYSTVYYLEKDLQVRTCVKNINSCQLLDVKSLLYVKNGDLFLVDPSETDAISEKIVDDVVLWRYNRNSRRLFYVSDGESFVVKLGEKPQRVVQEAVSTVNSLKNGFVYLMDGMAYYTEGGKGSKITGLGDDIKIKSSSLNWILFYDEDGTYYISTDGKTAARVWD